MAGSTGLEPAASGVTGRRSNQLNYDPNELTTENFRFRSSDLRLAIAEWLSANPLLLKSYQSANLKSKFLVGWAVQDSNL